MENGEFEKLDIAPLSSPPDLPYVMKSQETNGQEQTSWSIHPENFSFSYRGQAPS